MWATPPNESGLIQEDILKVASLGVVNLLCGDCEFVFAQLMATLTNTTTVLQRSHANH